MLTDIEKNLVRECFDRLRRQVEGFRPRRPQLALVAAVAHTLSRCNSETEPTTAGCNIGVVEAGTGTGKSFGALVPALVMARSRQKRLVVSSSTVALQEQYATKDVPTLQRALPFDFTFAVAKGRRRYVCAAKLGAAALQAKARKASRADGSDAVQRGKESHVRVVVELANRFTSTTWNGDRDELPEPVPDSLWNELTTDRQGCAGKNCTHFEQCPFYAARQRVKDADVIIANHDLVLASLGAETASALPPAPDTIYVFDEAHSLAAKVVDHLAAGHAVNGALDWLEGAIDAARNAVLSLRLDDQILREVRMHAEALRVALQALQRNLHAMSFADDKTTHRFKHGILPEWAHQSGETVHSAARGLQDSFSALREAMFRRAAREGRLATSLLADVGFFRGKVDNLVDTWDLMLGEDTTGAAPTARWIERHRKGAQVGDHVVCASPICGSDKLRTLLWNRVSAAVLMSATLTSCGTFDLFLQQTGLAWLPEQQLLQLASPFDYKENAQLVIPAMRCDPADAGGHTQEVIQRMPGLIRSLGTLVLFASSKQMHEVHAHLPDDLRRITLMQGDLPKGQMLDRHRAAVDRGDRSVLFGLQSLAEGVDLPREYCTHVIVAKLPFAVPDTPLEEARREWIESQGRSSFIEVTVPETSVRLKQGLGRLLRTDDDYGTATILDRRLVSKRWGGLLMKGLPDFKVVVEDVQRGRVDLPMA